MKKILIIVITFFVTSMLACDATVERSTLDSNSTCTEPTTVPPTFSTFDNGLIKIGYETGLGGQLQFDGLVAVTIPNSVVCNFDSIDITMSYGHITEKTEYTFNEDATYSIAIFISDGTSNSRDTVGQNFITLYEETIEEYTSDDYLVNNPSFPFSSRTFNKNMNISLSVEDLDNNLNKIFFVIERVETLDNSETSKMIEGISLKYQIVGNCIYFYE